MKGVNWLIWCDTALKAPPDMLTQSHTQPHTSGTAIGRNFWFSIWFAEELNPHLLICGGPPLSTEPRVQIYQQSLFVWLPVAGWKILTCHLTLLVTLATQSPLS